MPCSSPGPEFDSGSANRPNGVRFLPISFYLKKEVERVSATLWGVVNPVQYMSQIKGTCSYFSA